MPVLAEHLLRLLVGISDTALAGRFLDDSALAAMTVVTYSLWLLANVFELVAVGSTALVARFVGGGRTGQARRATNQSLVTGAVVAIAVCAALPLLARPFIRLMQLEGPSADMAVAYLWIIAISMPAMMVEVVGIACLRGAGDTVSGLVVMILVNLVNLLVSWSLMLGWGGLPELGWYALAVGTVAAHFTGGGLVLALLVKGRAGLRVRWRLLRPQPQLIRRLLRIGIPGGADSTFIVACHLWYLSIINSLGDLATAAHGVGVKVEALAFMPGAAFQVAATTLVGQYLGAGDRRRASRSVHTALAAGGAVMTTAAVMFFFAGGFLARVLIGGDKPEVVAITVPLLKIVAFATPLLAVQMVLSGALRGAGDTRVPFVFSVIGYLGVRIPLAYALAFDSVHLRLLDVTVSGWGLGVQGAWYAMALDTAVRCLLTLARWRHGGWSRVRV